MNKPTPHIVIIGAGAAGCFAAIEVKRLVPQVRVTVCEGKTRALAKVALTGADDVTLPTRLPMCAALRMFIPARQE